MSRTHVAVSAALLAIASVTAACSAAPPSDPAPAKKTTPTVAPSASAATPIEPVPNVPTTASSTTPPTVPGTTPTPSTPGTCNVTTGTPSCDTCLKQYCCTPVNACDADPDCAAADTCISQCYQQFGSDPALDQQCEQQCGTIHPQGSAKLQAIYQCMGTSCTGQCPQ